MRRNEVELIAALVEGRLEDETEARHLIESSAAHRAEYEAQKLAYEALTSMPPAELTEIERAALHRDVWTELQAKPSAEPARTPWYYRWSAAAAGLVVIVGLVVVVNQTNPASLSTQDAADQATGTTAAAGLERSATDAPAITEAAAAEGGGLEESDQAFAASPVDITQLTTFAAMVRAGEADTESFEKSPEREACLVIAGLEEHELISLFADQTNYLVAVPTGEIIGEETPVSFVDENTCMVIHTEE